MYEPEYSSFIVDLVENSQCPDQPKWPSMAIKIVAKLLRSQLITGKDRDMRRWSCSCGGVCPKVVWKDEGHLAGEDVSAAREKSLLV